MGKKNQEARYDTDGARRVMRKRDYMADFGGQLALGLMANLVGQLTYFYTDKVGMAVGGDCQNRGCPDRCDRRQHGRPFKGRK